MIFHTKGKSCYFADIHVSNAVSKYFILRWRTDFMFFQNLKLTFNTYQAFEMSSSDEETYTDYTSNDVSIDYNEIKTYGEYVSDDEDTGISDEMIDKMAFSFINSKNLPFMIVERQNRSDLPRVVWNRVLSILKENFNSDKYLAALCNLMDTNTKNVKDLNRIIDCMKLFQRPLELTKYDKYRYQKDVEIMPIENIKLTSDDRDEYDMSELDYMTMTCRDMIVKRVFESVSHTIIPDTRNPCHLWGCIPNAIIEVAIKSDREMMYDAKYLYKFVRFIKFSATVHSSNYYEKYKHMKIIMRDSKTWKMCKYRIPTPYLFRMERTLKIIGFPSIAAKYIREYLERTWFKEEIRWKYLF